MNDFHNMVFSGRISLARTADIFPKQINEPSRADTQLERLFDKTTSDNAQHEQRHEKVVNVDSKEQRVNDKLTSGTD